MAGRKLKLAVNIKASTILEVIIAMVIIIVVFGIAMMIFANVSRLSLSAKEIKAQAILQEIELKAEQTKEFHPQSIIIDDFRIEQEVKAFNDDSLLNEIHLTAYDANEKKITELQKVVIK